MGLPDSQPYLVWLRRRMKIAGLTYPAGTVVAIPADRLRVAAWLAECGAGRPADERTERDVALFLALKRVMPAG